MGKGHDGEIQRPRVAQDARTAVERGTSRKYIVEVHIFLIRSKAGSGNQCKGIFEVGLVRPALNSECERRVHMPPQNTLGRTRCRRSESGMGLVPNTQWTGQAGTSRNPGPLETISPADGVCGKS